MGSCLVVCSVCLNGHETLECLALRVCTSNHVLFFNPAGLDMSEDESIYDGKTSSYIQLHCSF